MLQAMLVTVQQQKSKLVLWVPAGVCMLLLACIATRYLWSYNSLIATTSATKAVNALLQTLVERYNRSHTLSKLSLSDTSPIQDSPSDSRREPPDFAVIAPGTPIPTGFAVIASLNEEKVILLSHKGNHFAQLREISHAAIQLVTIHEYDDGVLKKLLGFFEIPEQRNSITTMSVDHFLASKIVPNRAVYALFINPRSASTRKMLKTKMQPIREKLDVLDIDVADLTDDSRLFVSCTLKKGELSLHPLLPSEELDTVSALTYLVARTSVREEVVARLLTFLNASTKLLLDSGAMETLLTIEGISESKQIPFHSGYKKFLYGETEGFFQKNADLIYIVGVVLAALSSVLYSRYNKRKKKVDESCAEILDLFTGFEGYSLYHVSMEEQKKIAELKEMMCALIMQRSNKKTILLHSLMALLVLTTLTNAWRKDDHL
jgi:hypothetical protein